MPAKSRMLSCNLVSCECPVNGVLSYNFILNVLSKNELIFSKWDYFSGSKKSFYFTKNVSKNGTECACVSMHKYVTL